MSPVSAFALASNDLPDADEDLLHAFPEGGFWWAHQRLPL